ncbi:MAG: RecQ family ATP-dependent DNA helicase, partial [Candidatus Riflebacteria bacterium]
PENVVRLALTATATPQVQDDICSQLDLRNPIKLVGHPDRPNLVYRSFPRFDQSYQVLEIIRRHRNEGGIVYAQTRREVERLAKTLAKAGISCAPYHAGLSAQQRAKAQADFVHERLDVIVATIAFGMGINRSNVRYVVHANTPRSIEHYQQESGRAGRDGEPAECVLLFSAADLQMHRILAMRDENVSDIRRRAIDRQLSEIGRFAISPVCRHKLLVEHFGHPYPDNQQSENFGSGCRACDICLDETRALPDDEAHLTAQKIISAAFRTEGRFGAAYVAHVLIGHESQRIIENGHNQLKVFGILKDSSEKAVRGWIDQLIVQGSLSVTDGEYPMLRHTAEGLKVCRGEARVRLGHPVAKPIAAKTRRKKASAENVENPTLFENLRKLRLLLARRMGLPPYMIFADSVLMSLTTIKPEKLDELCEIKGIGEHKRDRYGEVFLKVIAGSTPEEAAETFKE